MYRGVSFVKMLSRLLGVKFHDELCNQMSYVEERFVPRFATKLITWRSS